MHADLPPDPPRLTAIHTYLRYQLKRVDEQLGGGTHPDLPQDERLNPIRTYLQLQLGRVEEQLGEAAAGEQWWMQHVPSETGGRGRGVLHRNGCRAEGSGRKRMQLSRRDAEIAYTLPRDEVELCELCDPARDLKPS